MCSREDIARPAKEENTFAAWFYWFLNEPRRQKGPEEETETETNCAGEQLLLSCSLLLPASQFKIKQNNYVLNKKYAREIETEKKSESGRD